MMDSDRRRRLRYRSWHRGTREMDLLMGSFADARLAAMSPEQLDRYENLLQLSDPDLYNWIAGVEAVPAAHDDEVMRDLCAHRFAQ